jgi:ankyrin repeat protein
VATRSTLLELAVLLVQHGTDIDALDDDGLTPFMHAALHGQVDMVTTFVQYGA